MIVFFFTMSVTFLLCLRNTAGEARNVGECSYGTNQYFDYLPTEEQDDYDSDEDFDYLLGEESDESDNYTSDSGENVSEYDNAEDVILNDTDEEFENVTTVQRCKRYVPSCPMKKIKFEVGLKFESSAQFLKVLKDHALSSGFDFGLKKSSKQKVEAVCSKPCPWRVYASWSRTEEGFIVKTMNDRHTCTRPERNRHATYKWIASHFIENFRMNLDWPISDMLREINEQFAITVSRNVCYKARFVARRMLEGSLNEHYHLLPTYVAKLRSAYPGSTFEMMLDRVSPNLDIIFRRLYICFKPLAEGFVNGCRRFIGLDGCFLKTEAKGQLLSAVGKDGNNQMFPIVWAVVEGENEDSWSWFIQHLLHNLNISDSNGWTIMSDQQKGLANAVASLLPYAEHRNCVVHILANWRKKGHSTETLRNMFCKTVKCTDPEEFQCSLREMASMSAEAAHDFVAIGVHKFCMAHIDERVECESIDNNISETFNSYILPYRGKRIIEILESIRKALMKRMARKSDLFFNTSDQICPRIRKLLEENIVQSRRCTYIPAGHDQFEVTIFGNDYVVDLRARQCSCRYWAISDIPCPHAIACIHWRRNDPANFVAGWYKKEKYMTTYCTGIPPKHRIRNRWDEVQNTFLVFPRIVTRKPGRPKIKRKIDMVERLDANQTMITRKGVKKQCSLCQQFGHNRRRCPHRTNQATDMVWIKPNFTLRKTSLNLFIHEKVNVF